MVSAFVIISICPYFAVAGSGTYSVIPKRHRAGLVSFYDKKKWKFYIQSLFPIRTYLACCNGVSIPFRRGTMCRLSWQMMTVLRMLYKNKEFKRYGNFQDTYIRAHGTCPALQSGTLPASRLPQAEPVDRFSPHTAEQPPCTGRLGQNADIHAGASTAHSRGVG